ncbi:MAG: hypothetical protein JOZ08_09555 [Verrucomicrobia bacterium]|nr:hypothetical protein [Verrucomicrobiota bacterium]MBV8274261.1 hypothetical protein [Verrucomicrobiota bacterium]
MKKPSIWVGLGTFALLASAWAGDFKLPDQSPVASFSIPASWKPAEYEDGVEAMSDDESVYIAVEATDLSSTSVIEDAMKQSLSYLNKKGVEVDQSTAKQTQAKLNGMDVVDVSWRGKDSTGECNVSLTVVVVTGKKGLLLTYWASPDGEKKNSQDLVQILHSIKPIQ